MVYINSRDLQMNWAESLRLAVVALAVVAMLLTGCSRSLRNHADTTPQIAAEQPQTTLSIRILRPDARAVVRANADLSDVNVKFGLTFINRLNTQNPVFYMQKAVAVSLDGSASAVFANVPALTVVAEVDIVNGSIGSDSYFLGALDMQAGVNNEVTVVPAYPASINSAVASIILQIATDGDLASRSPESLANLLSEALDGVDLSGSDYFSEAFDKIEDSFSPETDYSPDSLLLSGTEVLAQGAEVFQYSGSEEQISIKIPADNKLSYFALTITNISDASQKIILKPESDVASISASARLSMASHLLPDDLGLVRQNMEMIRARLRQAEIDRQVSGSFSSRPRPSLRLSASAEQVGDIVPLYIIANSGGSTYAQRNFRLAKISATSRLKIFVDLGEYEGYSAVNVTSKGDYRVTDDDLQFFADQFDNHIYPMMSEVFGSVHDIDNDGALSLVISPVYAAFGYAGLFNSLHISPSGGTYSNSRDMIAVWSPNNNAVGGPWVGEKWRQATIETVAHEMQHAISYSARFYPGGVANPNAKMEDVWLDESLSILSEAIYRIRTGAPVFEDRFARWAEVPSSVGMTSFVQESYELPDVSVKYGIVGLFGLYMWEQGGNTAIKQLIATADRQGVSNVDHVFTARGGFRGMLSDWGLTVLADSMKNKDFTDLAAVDARYSFTNSPEIDLRYNPVNYGQTFDSITIGPNATAFYVLRQPSNYKIEKNHFYQFRIESQAGAHLSINIMRLP